MPAPIYVRPLTEAELHQVQMLVRSSETVTHRRARVVWLSSQGGKVAEVVAATGLSERWVREVIHRFNQKGIASLPRRKTPGAKRACDPQARKALIALLHRKPAEFGIESHLWSAPDLTAVAIQLGMVPAVSSDTVRREVRRAGYRWQQAKRWSGKEPDYAKKETRKAPDRACEGQWGVGSGV